MSKLIQGWRSRHRLRDARPAVHRNRRSSAAPPRPSAPSPTRRPAPVDLALPGTLPVMNKGAVERAIEFGLARQRAHRAAQHLRAQELLLSRPAQGLPDQPVRDPGGAGRLVEFYLGDEKKTRAPGARAPRGGRRQVAARGLRRPVRHRPEPRRHAAAGDRDRAGHALVRRGGGLCEGAAQDRHLDRHLRRQHAGRQFPLRRQRVGAQARATRWARAARSRT